MSGDVIPIGIRDEMRHWLDEAGGDPDLAGAMWTVDVMARADAGEEGAIFLRDKMVADSITAWIVDHRAELKGKTVDQIVQALARDRGYELEPRPTSMDRRRFAG